MILGGALLAVEKHASSFETAEFSNSKEFFYDLLVEKEILPAETLAQMQEFFFLGVRVEKVACLMDR